MKKIIHLIILALLISSCEDENEKKTNDFLANFEEITLPYAFEESKKPEISALQAVESEFIDILVDTVERQKNDESYDFYYVGKIKTEKDYHIIIVCENINSKTQTFMPYQLITLTNSGEIISSLDFSVLEQDMDEKDYANLTINKDLEIEVAHYSLFFNDEKEILQTTNNYVIDDDGNIKQLESEEQEVAEMFGAFEKIDLPFEIKTANIGEKIKNLEFIKAIVPKHIDTNSMDYYLTNNAFFAVGQLQETVKYKAVIYRHQREGYGVGKYPQTHEYLLATFDANKSLINKSEIGEFSTIEDVVSKDQQLTESKIKLNSDFTILSSVTITLSIDDPDEKKEEIAMFSIESNGVIKKEEQNKGKQKLKKLLSAEDFEYIVKAKEDFEQAETAKQICYIFNVQASKVNEILYSMITKNNPDETDPVEKWKFIEEFLPFMIVDYGAEGMGVFATYNTYLLSEKAKQTPSTEDDLFFKMYNEINQVEEYGGTKQYGAPDMAEWETDVESYSRLGDGKFLKVFKLIQEALAKTTCFEKAIKEQKAWIISIMDYSGYQYSKEQVLKQIDKILNEVDFSEEEIEVINKAKENIKAKDDGLFNLKR